MSDITQRDYAFGDIEAKARQIIDQAKAEGYTHASWVENENNKSFACFYTFEPKGFASRPIDDETVLADVKRTLEAGNEVQKIGG